MARYSSYRQVYEAREAISNLILTLGMVLTARYRWPSASLPGASGMFRSMGMLGLTGLIIPSVGRARLALESGSPLPGSYAERATLVGLTLILRTETADTNQSRASGLARGHRWDGHEGT